MGADWQEICSQVRSVSEMTIRSSPEFSEAVERATVQAKTAFAEVEEQVRLRRLAGLIIDSTWEMEQSLHVPMLQSLADPIVNLDSVGVIVVASDMPVDPESSVDGPVNHG